MPSSVSVIAARKLVRVLPWCAVLVLSASCGLTTDSSAAAAQETIRFVRVWTGYREAQTFARFGDFREKDSEPGDAIVLRSQPEDRNGYYFTVRLRARKGHVIPDAYAVLHVVAPDGAAPRVFTFPFSARNTRSAQLLIGLTGSDWAWGETMPLAWKLEIRDASGAVLGREESFLWGDS